MSDEVRAAYRARFFRVVDFIDDHLDAEEDLSLERLADVASFSKFHFLRQWTALFGLGVHEHVQLARLRRASYQLAFRDGRSVIDVAMDSGYESPEAFARAFKKRFGQTPTDFRKQPEWQAWHAAYERTQELRRRHMQEKSSAATVEIVTFEETRVGVLEHRGDPARIGDTIRKFIQWRRDNALPPKVSATFNLLYGDPSTTPPEAFRLDLCAGVRGPVASNDAGVYERLIPAGRCARLRHVGSDDGLGATFARLYGDWLPASGQEVRDFPLYLRRVTFFPDVPEHEAVTEVYLPLK